MMFNNRRMYINRYPDPQKSIHQSTPTESEGNSKMESNSNAGDVKKLILDTFKSINDSIMDNIKEINRSISKLNERVESLENQQLTLEAQIDSEESGRNVISQSELSNIKTELELLRRDSSPIRPEEKKELSNSPVMPGSGFSTITAEYLRNLNKR